MNLRLSITSPLPAETWIAAVDLDGGGRELVRVEDGWFEGEFRARPTRLTLLLEPGDGARSSATPAPATRTENPRPVDVMELFGRGVAVPADGHLQLELLWLAPCDGVPEQAPEGTRFGSYEHTLCAALVGRGVDASTLFRTSDLPRPDLQIGTMIAQFNERTELPVGGKPLRFGAIIAMAGDYYAHLDEQAVSRFGWAWPPIPGLTGWIAGDYRATTLAGDTAENLELLDRHIHREVAGGPSGGVGGALATAFDAVRSQHPLRRYLALASQNICHFACQHGAYSETDNPALTLYRAYHRRALDEAQAAGEARDSEAFEQALVSDAFGCHFLTDLFASGHIRTPRAVLGRRFGISMGALVMSKLAHDEDNHLGLWVTTLRPTEGRRLVWRAFGDDALQRDDARTHLAVIQEAVRRSAAEVFAAYCAARTGTERASMPVAEDLVPVPLAPGEAPNPIDDVSPDGQPLPDFPANLLPMYTVLADGRVGMRVAGRHVPVELTDRDPAPGIVVP